MPLIHHANKKSDHSPDEASGTFRTATRMLSQHGAGTTAAWERFFRSNDAAVSQLSHDLSSPLGALLANVTLAREDIATGLEQWRALARGDLLPKLEPLLQQTLSDLEDALLATERVVEVGQRIKVFARARSSTTTKDVDVLALVTQAVHAGRGNLCGGITIDWAEAKATLEPSAPPITPWAVPINGARLTFALLAIFSSVAQSSEANKRWTIRVHAAACDRHVCLDVEVIDGEEPLSRVATINSSAWMNTAELADARALLDATNGQMEVLTSAEQPSKISVLLWREVPEEATW